MSISSVKGSEENGFTFSENSEHENSIQSDYDNAPKSVFNRFIDSFKPLEASKIENLSELSELEKLNIINNGQPLKRSLSSRHLQMIAISGSIGTGLFVSSGYALSLAGPAGLIIGYTIVGLSIYCMMFAAGEMSTLYPVSGSFAVFSSRFICPAWGFTVSWNYAFSWMISLPSEIIALSIVIGYWNSDIDPLVWVAIFWVAIVIINFFGARGYLELEVAFSVIKVLAIFGFIILSIILICGGTKDAPYIGAKYWHDPGAFTAGFKGICNVFITLAFSFGGVEMLLLCSRETKNPAKVIPRAIKQVFWRILLFYIVTSILVGCLVPYNDERLLGDSTDVAASPFVIAVDNAGIKVVPHIMNLVVLVLLLSVGNSCIYGSSRTLCALLTQGQAPKWIGYIDRQGRPLVLIVISSLFGLLLFLVDSANEGTAFTWLFSVCSLSAFFNWGSICFLHIRFRFAIKKQKILSKEDFPFRAHLGIYGSFLGLLLIILIVMGEIWVSVYPTGATKADVTTFFQNCLSLPLMIVMYLGYKTYKKQWGFLLLSLDEIDLKTGLVQEDIEILKLELREEKERILSKNILYRIFRFWC